MPVKKFRPVTPTLRFKTVSSFIEVTKSTPEKSLVGPNKKSGGRNSRGRITSRRRGGGHKRAYRQIDFKREKVSIPAVFHSIEYDPNRSARIALLHYSDGEKRYILSPIGLSVGDQLTSGPDSVIRVGNALPLANLPLGSAIHNVELQPGKGGQIGRSAGAEIQLMAKDGRFATLQLPSGERRLVRLECYATLGQVGNLEHENIVIGSAGRNRWKGRRPKVRGVAMNPIDHPHGGGEGRAGGGGNPVTPWGKPTRGYKTRKKNKKSSEMIVGKRKK